MGRERGDGFGQNLGGTATCLPEREGSCREPTPYVEP